MSRRRLASLIPIAAILCFAGCSSGTVLEKSSIASGALPTIRDKLPTAYSLVERSGSYDARNSPARDMKKTQTYMAPSKRCVIERHLFGYGKDGHPSDDDLSATHELIERVALEAGMEPIQWDDGASITVAGQPVSATLAEGSGHDRRGRILARTSTTSAQAVAVVMWCKAEFSEADWDEYLAHLDVLNFAAANW